ncbi:hypothetical protein GCM10023155_36100 [Bremerella cremea]
MCIKTTASQPRTCFSLAIGQWQTQDRIPLFVVEYQGISLKAPFLKVISDRNLVGEHSLS